MSLRIAPGSRAIAGAFLPRSPNAGAGGNHVKRRRSDHALITSAW